MRCSPWSFESANRADPTTAGAFLWRYALPPAALPASGPTSLVSRTSEGIVGKPRLRTTAWYDPPALLDQLSRKIPGR